MIVRNVKSEDHAVLSPLIDDWWGGREMAGLLPRLFFDHFQDTSIVVEKDGLIRGFLIGFLSQSNQKEAYIHFVGVDPAYRKQQLGSTLYYTFFEKAMEKGCTVVRAVTSPVNTTSIAYHTKMGFDIQEGDAVLDGVPVKLDYDGPGNHRVLFEKKL